MAGWRREPVAEEARVPGCFVLNRHKPGRRALCSKDMRANQPGDVQMMPETSAEEGVPCASRQAAVLSWR